MRKYIVNRFKHTVYDSVDEIPPSIIPIEDWREGSIGDWVVTDDECIIQILRKGKMLRKDSIRYYIGTCTGTFLVLPNTMMDADKRANIYSFGGNNTPEEVVNNRKIMTVNEEMFVQYIISNMSPEDAYVKAFPTNNRKYARIKAINLVKTERIKTAMKEELKPVLDKLGIDPEQVLSGIKSEAECADKADTRLKALFKLSDILDLEDKNSTKIQQISGAVFQGFTDNMIEEVERKELKSGKTNVKTRD